MPAIKGYRELTPEVVDSINDLKQKGEEIDQLLSDIYLKHFSDFSDFSDEEIEDARTWFKEGRKYMRVGLMLAIRSIARPTTF